MGTTEKDGGGLKMFGDAGSSRGTTAECVVSGNSVELPLLSKANYHKWALVMQVSLEALELWDAVEAECKERAKDRRALAAILRVSSRIFTLIKSEDDTRSWEFFWVYFSNSTTMPYPLRVGDTYL
jgi:hypothetical protein